MAAQEAFEADEAASRVLMAAATDDGTRAQAAPSWSGRTHERQRRDQLNSKRLRKGQLS